MELTIRAMAYLPIGHNLLMRLLACIIIGTCGLLALFALSLIAAAAQFAILITIRT